jgi:phenylacetate-CoA ligase
MGVAFECHTHEGLHVSSEHVICEILTNGEPAAPGEVGDVVLTDLDNRAMPFIRYAPGDMAAWSPQACSCGRGLPLLQSLAGRRTDVIVGPSGQAAHGILFSRALAQLNWFGDYQVRQFQVVQTSPEVLTIRLVAQTEPGAEAIGTLTGHLQDYLGPIRVEVELCDEIETSPSGKLRVCRSEIALR